NSIIKHYALHDFPPEAVFLYKFLKYRPGIRFDSFTYSYLLKACGNAKLNRTGIQFHCASTKAGFDRHLYVQTALLNMYGDCGRFFDARYVFDEMPAKNLVSWNVLITGFVKSNRFDEALQLFSTMALYTEMKPSEVTLLAIFPAIVNTGHVKLCQILHSYILKSGFDVRIHNCLIDSYAKCGSIESAALVFQGMPVKNSVSWTSIISAYAIHGMPDEASEHFDRMENGGPSPNGVTFLTILNGCSHGGLVEKGLEFYRKMVRDYDIEPDAKLYGCLVDLLGRVGRLEEAERVALEIIPRDRLTVAIWRTLLGACSFHGNVEMGERINRRIMEMEEKHGGDYVLFSNILSSAGRFVDSEAVRSLSDKRNASKLAG
ncbi:hypothetical protein M569_13999, partial [Genlisea aurea]